MNRFQIVGDALVGISFVRNILSVVMLFGLTPWLDKLGVRDFNICIAFLCLGFLLMTLPLIFWGKKARIATEKKYRYYAMRQPLHRDFSMEY